MQLISLHELNDKIIEVTRHIFNIFKKKETKPNIIMFTLRCLI